MFSAYGDTVFDPFAGTGTTTLAAMDAARNSRACELDADLVADFDDRLDGLPGRSRDRCRRRLDEHREFVAEREAEGSSPGYDAVHYEFPVVTKQERHIRFYAVEAIDPREREGAGRRYAVEHVPI